MDGVINICKEQGFTSHDVVAKMRGMLHMKKIGHTGTLDPDATGVLPVCLGKATKLCGMITDWKKTYEAVMLLGTVTDTQDISGKILEKNEVNVDEAQVVSAVNSFAGEYSQVPPMYSALKHNGKKLYELARAGVEIEREPRMVNIDFIHVNEIDLSEDRKIVKFTVECSKGTYVRTLCDDIGKKLSCGACMESLKRIRVGQFSIDDSITLSELDDFIQSDNLNQCIVPVDEMFSDYNKIVVKEESGILVHNGNKFRISDVLSDEFKSDDLQLFRVYDFEGSFVGIYQFVVDTFIPVKMFYDGPIK